jgi:hypothetical protein
MSVRKMWSGVGHFIDLELEKGEAGSSYVEVLLMLRLN